MIIAVLSPVSSPASRGWYWQCPNADESGEGREVKVERGTGFEPATICLEGRDSSAELPPLGFLETISEGLWRPGGS